MGCHTAERPGGDSGDEYAVGEKPEEVEVVVGSLVVARRPTSRSRLSFHRDEARSVSQYPPTP